MKCNAKNMFLSIMFLATLDTPIKKCSLDKFKIIFCQNFVCKNVAIWMNFFFQMLKKDIVYFLLFFVRLSYNKAKDNKCNQTERDKKIKFL